MLLHQTVVRSVASLVPRQKFKYFLVLDFEATCDEPGKKVFNEIIEFPVLLVDGQSFDELDHFHRFVRPSFQPKLSQFCTQLTGISQQTVELADNFPHVWREFSRWLNERGLLPTDSRPVSESFAFATCGNWDLSVALRDELLRHNLKPLPCMKEWINVKECFRSVVGKWPKGLSHMLSELRIEPIGRPHSGMDDSRNTLLLMRVLAQKGHTFNITNRLPDALRRNSITWRTTCFSFTVEPPDVITSHPNRLADRPHFGLQSLLHHHLHAAHHPAAESSHPAVDPCNNSRVGQKDRLQPGWGRDYWLTAMMSNRQLLQGHQPVSQSCPWLETQLHCLPFDVFSSDEKEFRIWRHYFCAFSTFLLSDYWLFGYRMTDGH